MKNTWFQLWIAWIDLWIVWVGSWNSRELGKSIHTFSELIHLFKISWICFRTFVSWFIYTWIDLCSKKQLYLMYCMTFKHTCDTYLELGKATQFMYVGTYMNPPWFWRWKFALTECMCKCFRKFKLEGDVGVDGVDTWTCHSNKIIIIFYFILYICTYLFYFIFLYYKS